MFHCIERTLDIKTRFYKIRLWISQESVRQTYEELQLERHITSEITRLASGNFSVPPPAIENLIVSISEVSDKINAIQIKDRASKHKNGLMVYTIPF